MLDIKDCESVGVAEGSYCFLKADIMLAQIGFGLGFIPFEL